MIDYSRELYAERERSEKDYWDAKEKLPTKEDLEWEKPKEDEEEEELDWE